MRSRMSERESRFAGMFFPDDRRVLAHEVNAHLAGARAAVAAGPAAPRAIVSAHAGYAYSGRFAGLSFSAVGWQPQRVVILSPSHRYGFSGIAFPSHEVFATPLGPLAIDREACSTLAAAGLAHEDDAAHDNEHGIETQLPFIRTLWPEARIVPLVCGAVPERQVAAAIDALDQPGTLVVISSDLSHFLTQGEAQEKDAETARLVETGNSGDLTSAHACGSTGLNGWLRSRAGQASKALRLGLGDSAAVSDDRARVVGYGAWAFYGIDEPMLAPRWQEALLSTARDALGARVGAPGAAGLAADHDAAPLGTHAASFVTLTEGGRLRGCIGSLAAHRSLAEDVAANAVAAGLRDPRFAPVAAADLNRLRLKVAVLSRPAPLSFGSEDEARARIVPGLDGVILSSAGRRGVFLPMVWESLPEPADFLDALKQKAGLPRRYWAEDLTLQRFRAESFAEPEPVAAAAA